VRPPPLETVYGGRGVEGCCPRGGEHRGSALRTGRCATLGRSASQGSRGADDCLPASPRSEK
jgi:hypothetical protein